MIILEPPGPAAADPYPSAGHQPAVAGLAHGRAQPQSPCGGLNYLPVVECGHHVAAGMGKQHYKADADSRDVLIVRVPDGCLGLAKGLILGLLFVWWLLLLENSRQACAHRLNPGGDVLLF